jgi:hypothetical protein
MRSLRSCTLDSGSRSSRRSRRMKKSMTDYRQSSRSCRRRKTILQQRRRHTHHGLPLLLSTNDSLQEPTCLRCYLRMMRLPLTRSKDWKKDYRSKAAAGRPRATAVCLNSRQLFHLQLCLHNIRPALRLLVLLLSLLSSLLPI